LEINTKIDKNNIFSRKIVNKAFLGYILAIRAKKEMLPAKK
jgi:predicted DNA-binding transcriptional regulator